MAFFKPFPCTIPFFSAAPIFKLIRMKNEADLRKHRLYAILEAGEMIR